MKKLLLCGLLLSANAFAASTNKYWIGGAGDNFTDDTKWSLSSGGGNDTTTPGATDIANFTSGGNTNCNFSAAVNVAGFKILSGYTQTITQSTYTLTVGADDFSQADGIFTGGSVAITINGSWTLSGGTFTSTSGTLQVSEDFDRTGGTFTHSSGTVNLTSSGGNYLRCSDSLYTLTLNMASESGIISMNTANLTVANTLTITTGTLSIDGLNLTVTSTFTVTSGSTLRLRGSETVTTPTLDAGSIVTYRGGSGAITMKNWTYSNLVLDDTDSTFKFGEAHTELAGLTLTLGTFDQSAGDYAITCTSYTQAAGTFTGGTAAVTVNGDFVMSNGTFTSTSGTLQVSGDVNKTGGTFTHNSGTLNITGPTKNFKLVDDLYTVTVNKNAEADWMFLDAANLNVTNTLTITTGTLYSTLEDISCTNAFTITSGSFLIFQGSETVKTPTLDSGSTVVYKGTGATLTLKNWSYKNLTLNDTYAGATTFKFGEAHTGIETFTLTAGVFSQSAGDYAITCTGYTQTGGTFTGGTAALTVNGAFALSTGAFTSTSGTLTVQGNFVRTSGTFTHNSGTVDFTSGAATVTCTDSFRNITVNKTAETTLLNLGANLTAANTITVTTGTLYLAGYDLACTSTFSITAGSFLQLKGTESSVKTPTLAATSTVTYIGDNVASTKTCKNWTYSNITFNDANANKSTFVFGETHTSIATFTLTDGTFSQAGGDYAITCTDYSQTGGTWDGGSATFAINGTWTLNGGEFQCGTGIILARKNWTYTSGTVTPETSTVKFGSSTYTPGTVTGTHTLNNVVIWSDGAGGGNKLTIATGTTVTANGTLDILPGTNWMKIEGGGTIAAKGNITFNANSIGIDSTTATLLINGTTAQTLTGASASYNQMNVTINKSDTLNLSGTLTFGDATRGPTWTYTAGTIAPGTSTINFICCTITGTHTLGNVGLAGYGSTTLTISAGTTLTITGTTTWANVGAWGTCNGPGTVEMQGDVNLGSFGVLGNLACSFTGTANQSLTYAGSSTFQLNPITINKASGTVSQATNCVFNTTGQDFALTSGTFYLNGYALTVADSFVVAAAGTLQLQGGTDSTSKVPTLNTGSTVKYVGDNTGGSYVAKNWTYKNLTIADANGTPCTFRFGETHTGMATFAISGGTFSQALGDYAITCTDYSQTGGTWDGGSEAVTFSTSWTLNGGEFQCGSSAILMDAGTWTYTSGTLTPETSTVTFKNTNTINGTFALTNVTLWNSAGGTACGFTVANTMTVNGTLTLKSSSSAVSGINTGIIAAKGDITQEGTTAFFGGTGTLLINGTGPQVFTGVNTETVGGMCNIEINKADTLSLVGTIRMFTSSGTRAWTLTAGTLNPGTSTVVFDINNCTITGTQSLYNVTLRNSAGATGTTTTIAAGTTLTATGTLKFASGGGQLNINTGNLVAQGNINIADSVVYAGSVVLSLTGTAAQSITSSGGDGTFRLTPFTINKASNTVTLLSNLNLNYAGQDFALTSGTFDLDGFNFTINDGFTVDGTLRLKNSETISKAPTLNTGSTVEYKGTGAASSQTARNWTYKNLSFIETSGTPDTFKFGETHTGITALTISNNAIFSQAAGDYAITAAIYNQTGGTFTGGTAALTISGNWDLSVGAFTSTSGTFTCTGNITHTSGTFTHNNGTVALTGGSQQITGNTTFYTLTKNSPNTTLTFGAGNTQTIANNLSLQGSVATYMNLRSTTPGTFFIINVPATKTMKYLDLQDAQNGTPAKPVYLDRCRRSGKTYGFIFPGL